MIAQPHRPFSASIRIDLIGVVPARQRHRVAVLNEAPPGCRVQINVGDLSVEPATVRELLEHVGRIRLELQGSSPRAVQRWRDALSRGGT